MFLTIAETMTSVATWLGVSENVLSAFLGAVSLGLIVVVGIGISKISKNAKRGYSRR